MKQCNTVNKEQKLEYNSNSPLVKRLTIDIIHADCQHDFWSEESMGGSRGGGGMESGTPSRNGKSQAM